MKDKEKSNEKVKVGWVQRAHGIAGEIYIRLYHPRPDWLGELTCFTLTSPLGVSSEYVVEGRLSPHKEGLIMGCEGVKDRDRAETLKGYSMEIPRSYLVAEGGGGDLSQ